MSSAKSDPLWSLVELSEEENVPERFLRRLIEDERIDYVKMAPGRNGPVRIRKSVWLQWVEDHTVRARE